MISRTTEEFRKELRLLPKEVRRQAKQAYHLFMQDPYHNSLQFKRVHQTLPLYSARVNDNYRVVGIRRVADARGGERVVWYFIGTHAEYDKELR